MIKRQFWLKKIENAWRKKSIIWLAGVRRCGKTSLCRSLGAAEYFDCELPRTRQRMEDPESFLQEHEGKSIILDEIHRLSNPSELLKIASDHYPNIKIIATGSSSLGASAKFKDTLTGRKENIWLTPMNREDLVDFKHSSLPQRLFKGGLPPFFLATVPMDKEYQNWVDDFWSKDIQELFRIERRYSFIKFFELLMAQSGGIFEASKFTAPCEISRQTVSNYLGVLEATFIAHILRPYHTHLPTEITAAPKVYAFDTGFISYYRGWGQHREDDLGVLWEHFVLNEIHAQGWGKDIHYWRDKRGHEIDFVMSSPQGLRAVECKWKTKNLEAKNFLALWERYPNAKGYVVAADVKKGFTHKVRQHSIRVVSLAEFIEETAQTIHR